jgi:hypothetical protein
MTDLACDGTLETCRHKSFRESARVGRQVRLSIRTVSRLPGSRSGSRGPIPIYYWVEEREMFRFLFLLSRQ